jgi:hypothetical protein
MTRFDATQSNHPQANAPWAGQTQSSGPGTDRGDASGWPLSVVDRGAPFVVALLIVLADGMWATLFKLGLLPSGQFTLFFPGTVLVFVVYLYFARRWQQWLWHTRWEKRSVRGVGPERFAFLTTAAAVVASAFLPIGQQQWIVISLFGLQAALFLVIAPITMRRYPGLR